MLLKNYQNTAVKKLLTRSVELLSENGNKKLVFKSPTGSGKTIMMADFLSKLVAESTYYGSFDNSGSSFWENPELRDLLEELSCLDVEQVYILLLAILCILLIKFKKFDARLSKN
jgi:hypothetical protein